MMGLFLDYAGGVLHAARPARVSEPRWPRNATTTNERKTRRRGGSRKRIQRGDVVKSAEVNTWFMIAGGTLMLMVFAAPMATSLAIDVRAACSPNPIKFRPMVRRSLRLMKTLAMRCACGARHSASCCSALAALAGNVDPAPHRVLGRAGHAAAVENFAGGRSRAACSRRQALANFAKGLAKLALFGAVMARCYGRNATGLAAWSPPIRRSILPFTRALAMQDAGHGGGDPRHRRDRRLSVSVPAMVRAAENVAAGDEGGVPADRGRSGRQRQTPAIAHGAHAQAHDGGGAEGLGRHHQPDPLRRRAADTSAA